MDKDRWIKVQSLFERALEHDASERDAFVKKECGDDVELYKDVSSLLAADESPHSLFGGQAIDTKGLTDLSREGRRIGPYRVIERIGTGGMGAVYRAERADGQFEQTVALKVVKRGMDTEAILERFHAERQILAHLDHPNIARLLDGGVTDDGLPFFTMEFVDGIPIDRYCDENRLSINERLELFRTVLSAAQYAHRALVVHRDLKPSNILVTKAGSVKLLDFGIAKMLGDDEEAPATLTKARMMTPAYASPEQVSGGPVTTATDVYSLGVVLYELLSGRRPYSIDTPEGIERVIRMTDPDKPSRAVARKTDPADKTTSTPEVIAHARRSHPAQVRRRLAGDLDNICMMALRKESDRRYASAGHFADDIERHLESRPVAARTDTAGYRFRKFILRNRVGVGVAVGVIATIAALVTFYTLRLTKERNRARLEAAKAAQVSDFLASLFAYSEPDESKGEQMTAREMLDRGAARLQTELEDQPEVRATMMTVVGDVYLSLGLYDEAANMVEQALAIRRQLFGDESLEVVKTLGVLLNLKYETGDFERAQTLAREILNLRLKLLSHNHPDIGLAMNDLGWILYEEDSLAVAEDLNRKALAIRRAAFGDKDLAVAESLGNLGIVLMAEGDLEDAETYLRQSLAIRRELAEDQTAVGYALNNLAALLEMKGEFAEAKSLYEEALDLYTKLLGSDHPDLATPLTNTARLMRKMGDYDGAVSRLNRAVELDRQRGETHGFVAYDLTELGRTFHDMGKYEESEKAFRDALRIYRESQSATPSSTASALLGLGQLLTDMGKPQQAEPLLREAMSTITDALGADYWKVSTVQSALGACLTAQGRYEEAETLLLAAYSRRDFPNEREERLKTAQRLVHLYERWGRADEAEPYRSFISVANTAP